MTGRINFAFGLDTRVIVDRPHHRNHGRIGTVIGYERGGVRVAFETTHRGEDREATIAADYLRGFDYSPAGV